MKAARAYCRGCCRDVATLLTEDGWRCGICERLITPAVVVNATPDAVARFAREAHKFIDTAEMDTLPTIGGNPIPRLTGKINEIMLATQRKPCKLVARYE